MQNLNPIKSTTPRVSFGGIRRNPNIGIRPIIKPGRLAAPKIRAILEQKALLPAQVSHISSKKRAIYLPASSVRYPSNVYNKDPNHTSQHSEVEKKKRKLLHHAAAAGVVDLFRGTPVKGSSVMKVVQSGCAVKPFRKKLFVRWQKLGKSARETRLEIKNKNRTHQEKKKRGTTAQKVRTKGRNRNL